MRRKNLSIELLKFIAVVVVLNSHMDGLYGKYDFLATGGAIGDALFFFVSGFTLFLGRFGRFDNWYKRRIRRIYPSVIALAALLSLVGIEQLTVSQVIIRGGYWFVSVFMLYYVVLFFIRKYAERSPVVPFLLSCLVIIIWYLFEDKSSVFMYGNTYFKWCFNFLFMLAGAYVGNKTIELKSRPWLDFGQLLFSLVLYYGLLFLAEHSSLFSQLQLLSIIPLMGIIIYAYKLCITKKAVQLMRTKSGMILQFISGLCLEAYLVQISIIPIMVESCRLSFPINALLTVLIVIVAAYIIRCLGRIFLQIFQVEDMDWKAVFEPIHK